MQSRRFNVLELLEWLLICAIFLDVVAYTCGRSRPADICYRLGRNGEGADNSSTQSSRSGSKIMPGTYCSLAFLFLQGLSVHGLSQDLNTEGIVELRRQQLHPGVL